MHRSRVGLASPVLGLVIAAALWTPASAVGQDVLQVGRTRGVAISVELERLVQQEPNAFEFTRAWRNRVARLRAARAALEAREGPYLSAPELEAQKVSLTGVLSVAVVGALYADQSSPRYSAASYQSVLFGNSDPLVSPYTVRTFYREVSRGAFEVTGTVPTWVTLPDSGAFYRPSPSTNADFGRTKEFLKDALDRADPGMDFGAFDNDGPDGIPNSGDDDGFVDVAAFLYQDAPKSCGGVGIWPHRWVYRAWWGTDYVTTDPAAGGGFIRVSDYMVQSGVGCDGSSMMQIGTFAHELGHAIGLPDLYDTDSNNGNSEGVGYWGLMGSGNWNMQDAPAHLSAWSKDYLGWVSVQPLTVTQGARVLPEVKVGGDVLRYNLPGTSEYFLLEHREATGSDKYLKGPGLLVWHVDPTVIDTTRNSNRVNGDETHKGVDLEEADGLANLDQNVNRADAGDPFPGSTANTVFGPGTNPNSNNYLGSSSAFALNNIALSSGVLSFDVALSKELTVSGPDPVLLAPSGQATRPLNVATIDDSAVGVKVTNITSWLTVTPDTVQTPATVTLSYDAAGLTAGTYVDTLRLFSSQVDLSPVKQVVRLDVATNLIALGDTVVGTLSTPTEVDTFVVALAGGESIDLALYGHGGTPLKYLRLWLYDPVGSIVATVGGAFDNGVGGTALVAKWQAATSGTHRIVVRSSCSTCSGAGYFGDYVLKARESGTVVAMYPGNIFKVVGAPFGGTTASDTIWVYNAGAQAGSWLVTSQNADVSVSVGGGTLPAGAASLVKVGAGADAGKESPEPVWPQADRGPSDSFEIYRDAAAAPTGSVPVVVTVDLSGFAEGRTELVNAVLFQNPDGWAGPAFIDVDVWAYDPDLELVVDGLRYSAWGLAGQPDGQVAAGVYGELWHVDPNTGILTYWGDASPGYNCLRGLDVGRDGTAYVSDSCNQNVRKVTSAGVSAVLTGGLSNPYDVAALPDGAVYAIEYTTGLWRIDPNGTKTNVAAAGVCCHTAVAYDPTDGNVYYAYYNQIHRYSPGTGTSAQVGTVADYAFDLERGASGRWYVRHYQGVWTYSETFQEIDHAALPYFGYGLALVDGAVLANTYGCLDLCGTFGAIYRLAVADRPAGQGDIPVWVPDTTASKGDTIAVPVFASLSANGGAIGSFEASLRYDTTVVKYVSVDAGDFQGTFTPNTDSASVGLIRFAGINTDGSANRDTTRVAGVRFAVVGEGGDSTTLVLSVPSMAKTSFEDVTSKLQVVSGWLRVSTGFWGDPNRDDKITALDALICLSHMVGKDVSQFDPTACDVAPDSGETFTGKVTALDALAILSHVVGKALPVTFRVGVGR